MDRSKNYQLLSSLIHPRRYSVSRDSAEEPRFRRVRLFLCGTQEYPGRVFRSSFAFHSLFFALSSARLLSAMRESRSDGYAIVWLVGERSLSDLFFLFLVMKAGFVFVQKDGRKRQVHQRRRSLAA